MNKKITHQAILLLGLLLVFQAVVAQSGQNPFAVKQKTPTTKSVITPAPLNAGPLLNAMQGQRNLQTASGYNYHSILFQNPVLNRTSRFAEQQYDKNGLLILAENAEGYGVPFNSRSEEATVQACYAYLEQIKSAMRIQNPEQEFIPEDQWEDEMGFTHVRMQQFFQGLEVFGGEILLHGSQGMINRFNGTYYPTPNINDLTPQLQDQQAVDVVIQDVSTLTSYAPMSEEIKSFFNYDGPEAKLIIYHYDRDLGSERLAWHVSIRPNVLDWYQYFVDAKTGEIINKFNNTCTDGPATAQAVDLNGVTQTINTYLKSGTYYMLDASRPMFNAGQSDIPDNPVGAIVTLDANYSTPQNLTAYYIVSQNNSWNNPTAVSAHTNAGVTYEYYRNTHSRNSIDGNGGTIYSVINVNDDNGGGLDNAFWNGQAMFYGNGDQKYLPLAGALDVGGHEMTHGVIQNTANLIYQNEPGAINESMADIGGTMVDREDWQLGEDIIPANSPYFPTGALRDMENPHNGGSSFNDDSYQPAHVNEMYQGSGDNGGVHINSGIINHAYYLLATDVTKNKAEKIFYKALSAYMTKSSQFIDCRLAFESAAKEIYGNNSSEYDAVVNAFYSVGIGQQGGGGGGSPGPGEIEVNPGQDYILSVDVDASNPNTLYISNTEATQFVPISQTKPKRKPSITDNGAVAVFVDENSTMRAIALTDPYDEWQLQNPPEQIWDNIAVSKDGSRIAAITTEVDSAIWIYDFNIGQWAKFHLYNPTFSEGVVTENVLYADAIEWDYSGQYLIYDAFNKMENEDGQDISYWDMGFIRVWDNGSNNWSDGKIFKLFSALPEGISIGNPSLAKNTPYIIAFDFYDDNTGDISVMAANLESGDVGEIFQNQVLGFPNYSKMDNKLVFSTLGNDNTEIVGQISLQSDKINPTGDASGLIGYAKWPVWYAMGERDLMDVDETLTSDMFANAYPNPFSNEITLVAEIKNNNPYNIKVFNVYGQLVKEISGVGNSQMITAKLNTGSWAKGTYLVRINNGRQTTTRKIVKVE
ncbi:MAG: T9SS type A sorting domain-containing protein [Chlorobi bacterium]|nr:T9SS type A sorting domain-containing protein [Chlorobiota bacterium]